MHKSTFIIKEENEQYLEEEFNKYTMFKILKVKFLNLY